MAEVADLLHRVSTTALEAALVLILEACRSGRRVYVMGNGGSASTASHLVCDMTKASMVGDSPLLRAFAIGDNGSLLTAVANDRGYEHVFSEQLSALLDPGDVVVAISVSGRSPNVLQGLGVARERGASTVGLLGGDGDVAARLADVLVLVPCDDPGRVESVHLAIVHLLAESLGRALAEDAKGGLLGEDLAQVSDWGSFSPA